jgi:chromate transporter
VSTFLPQIALSALNWKGLILGVALWVLTNLIKPTKKFHPIVFIGLAAVVGIVFSM